MSYRNLRLFRQFYLLYPQISERIGEQFHQLNLLPLNWQSSIANSKSGSGNVYVVSPDKLLTKLSYTHLVPLFPIGNPLKRAFQNKVLFEYAVADSDMPLFVTRYVLELPNKEQLEILIKNELTQL